MTDDGGITKYCSTTEQLTLTPAKGNGKNSFTNVSKKLLTVLADIDDDTYLERTPLFGDDAYMYFWEYDNQGLRLAQLRFYDEYSTQLQDAYEYNCTDYRD